MEIRVSKNYQRYGAAHVVKVQKGLNKVLRAHIGNQLYGFITHDNDAGEFRLVPIPYALELLGGKLQLNGDIVVYV